MKSIASKLPETKRYDYFGTARFPKFGESGECYCVKKLIIFSDWEICAANLGKDLIRGFFVVNVEKVRLRGRSAYLSTASGC